MRLIGFLVMIGWGYLWTEVSPDSDVSLLLTGHIWIMLLLIFERVDDIAKILKKEV